MIRHTEADLSRFTSVAVTGSSGFVGRHVVSHLQVLGAHVWGVDLMLPADATIEHRRADLRRPEEVRRGLDGADLVIHLAGNANGTRSVEDPGFDFESNTVASFEVGRACSNLGAKLVYMSSACIYGTPRTNPITEHHPTNPILPYGASKLAAETIIRTMADTYGLDSVIARSFVIYGPGEDPRTASGEVSQFLRWHLNELPIELVGDPVRKTRDFIHVSDVARALVVLADCAQSKSVVNVGTGTGTTMAELSDIVGASTGRPAVLAADDSVLDDSFSFVADTTTLDGLGFRPLTSLSEGTQHLARALGPFPELPGSRAVFRAEQATRNTAG